MFEEVVSLVGSALTATTGWGLKTIHSLSTRVAVLEKGQIDILPLMDAKLDTIMAVCEQLEKRLDRLERVANGKSH
jgi:hypothetical protein